MSQAIRLRQRRLHQILNELIPTEPQIAIAEQDAEA